MVGLARRVIGKAAPRERLSFRLVWLIGSARLRLSAASALHTLPPAGLEAALHYTVVIRPPAHVGTSVAPILQRLREISPHHHYYPADSMHVTMGGVGQFLHDGVDATARLAELRSVIGLYQSFDLTVRGLNVSPSTLFAEVIPHGGTLRALRADLRMIGGRAGGTSGFGDYIRYLLPHMNLVRFSGRVTKDFLEEVSRSRLAWFERWTVSEVELIRTDTLLSRESRQVLARIPLAPIHQSA
jgi:2'-5' RNA ligase